MFYWPGNTDQAEAMDEDGGERKEGRSENNDENSGMQKWADNQLMRNECGYINGTFPDFGDHIRMVGKFDRDLYKRIYK